MTRKSTAMLLLGVLVGMFVPLALLYYTLTAPDADEDIPSQEQIIRNTSSGDLAALPDHLVNGCGKYFTRHGTTIVFKLVMHEEGELLVVPYFVVPLHKLNIVLNDSLEQPFARKIVLSTGDSGAEITISSKDYQRARCLSVAS